ncbi:MAG: ECF transporter S component [Oscillospiraceae bacterium]|nr:ECF transporter S component [Oscillospiraceae bacterium]
MDEKRTKKPLDTYRIVFIALMAAIVCVVTLFRFPLLGSKVHFANAMCLLAGLLFGPVGGGLAAGIGSGLYDGLFGGYDILECLITFVSKFLMACICGMIVGTARGRENRVRIPVGAVVGALSYVALYMLKTYIYQRFVYGYPNDVVWLTMLSKLPASLINAVFAMIVAPILYAALCPALQRSGMLSRLR